MKLKDIKGLKRFCMLGFPKDDWIIFGGSVLAAYGIRETDDLDIMVSPYLYEICETHPAFFEFDARFGKGLKLSGSNIEIFDNILPLTYNFEEVLIRTTEEIIGKCEFNLMTLHFLRAWKMESARDKDFRDVDLIDSFINIKTKM